MDIPLLWHIPLSHFNEKVRWALDFKGIAHHRRPPGLDYLLRGWRATGQGKLPILWLEGRPLHDSTRIIAAIEAHTPLPALYPADGPLRTRALALEEDLDETLGPALRAAFFTPLFERDPEVALRILTTGMAGNYATLRRLLRVFPAYYRMRHRIRAANLESDRATVLAALDRIESVRAGRAYLVGEQFSVADLTAAALVSPLLQPPEIQYPMEVALPDYAEAYRRELLAHPAMRWALETYRRHRGTSAQVRRREAA